MNILAIDDEPLALKQLERYIKSMPFMNLVGTARDSYEAMQILTDNKVDAIFLDINMPGMDGMSFVRSLTTPPMIVFTTAYSEYAVDSYKLNAVDYLLKPFGLEDFQRAAFKLLEKEKQTKQSASDSSYANGAETSTGKENQRGYKDAPIMDDDTDKQGEGNPYIYLKSDYQKVRVAISDIRYIEAMSEYLRIYISGEKKPLTTLLSMRKMEEFLPKDHFMRIHRSYIICLDKIQSVQKLSVNMGSDTILPVGDQYKEAFANYINMLSIGR